MLKNFNKLCNFVENVFFKIKNSFYFQLLKLLLCYRHSSPLPSSTHRQLTSHQRPLQQDLNHTSKQHFLINGSSSPPPLFRVLDTNNSATNPFLTSEDVRPNHHVSRYATFHNTGSSSSAIHQRDSSLPYSPQQSSASPPVRGYSPYRTYQVSTL